jgi:hypothetical protein
MFVRIRTLVASGFDRSRALCGTAVTILNGTLAPASTPDPIPGQDFSVSDPGAYRYIKFEPHSVAVGGTPCCGANNNGPNEVLVFSDPVAGPEASSLLLFVAGLGAIKFVARTKRAD